MQPIECVQTGDWLGQQSPKSKLQLDAIKSMERETWALAAGLIQGGKRSSEHLLHLAVGLRMLLKMRAFGGHSEDSMRPMIAQVVESAVLLSCIEGTGRDRHDMLLESAKFLAVRPAPIYLLS